MIFNSKIKNFKSFYENFTQFFLSCHFKPLKKADNIKIEIKKNCEHKIQHKAKYRISISLIIIYI